MGGQTSDWGRALTLYQKIGKFITLQRVPRFFGALCIYTKFVGGLLKDDWVTSVCPSVCLSAQSSLRRL